MSPSSILSLSLLLDVRLSTSLRSFASIVHGLVVCLSCLVTSQAGKGASNRACDTVADTGPKILHLSLSFLCLTFLVLADAFLFETLCAKGATDELLS
jgi:hypothetical protein